MYVDRFLAKRSEKQNSSSNVRTRNNVKLHRRSKKKGKDNMLFLVFVFLAILLINMNIIHHRFHFESGNAHLKTSSIFLGKNIRKSFVKKDEQSSSSWEEELSCGKMSSEKASELVYWSDIESDEGYESPFYGETKYLTFEPDQGGWNNIRMAWETVLVLAHAMGRTLVLPPDSEMYLLGKGDKKQKKKFGFDDFFDLKSINEKQSGINIIPMEDFLLSGFFSDAPVFFNTSDLSELWSYLGENALVSDWNTDKCIIVFPSTNDVNRMQELNETLSRVMKLHEGKDNHLTYKGNPVSVESSIEKRIGEITAERKYPCFYDAKMQEAPLIHIQNRMLIQYYSSIIFEDWKQDLWAKRFVRDHIVYKTEILCAAARVIAELRQKAKHFNKDTYDSFHIRRNEFQYKRTRITIQEIYKISKDYLENKTTLYIATDETDKTFFTLLKQYYNVYFLDDFMHLLEGINTNYYGMIDQLVCVKSHLFFGTYRSTFSGFINRLRGYHSVKSHLPGYKDGTLDSWYFAPIEFKDEMRVYASVKKPFYQREFPIAWRNIDKGIKQLWEQA